jgi:hypothetical protein
MSSVRIGPGAPRDSNKDPALDASILLTPEQTTAYLHWLETGDGECPLPDGFG